MGSITTGGSGTITTGGAGSITCAAPGASDYPMDQIISVRPSTISLSQPAYLTPTAIPGLDTEIVRITDATVFGGSYDNYRHLYPKRQPWNCDGTWLWLEHIDGNRRLLDGTTYALLDQPTTWNTGLIWDVTLPHRAWATDLYAGGQGKVVQMDINPTTYAMTGTVWAMGDGGYAAGYTSWSSGAGEGNFSDDGRYNIICADRLGGCDIILVDYQNLAGGIAGVIHLDGLSINTNIDWGSMSPSGTYVIIAYNYTGTFKYEVYDRATLTLQRTLTEAFMGHADFGYDSAGNEVLVYVGAVSGGMALKTYRLSDGTVTQQLAKEFIASNYHISCRNTARHGWAYFSSYADPGDDTTRYLWDEVCAVKLDASGTIERFSQTFRHDDNPSTSPILYTRMSMGVPSHDGKRVLFASDWGVDSGAVVYDYVAGVSV